VGDGITCWGEYRGYILDCGGADLNGENPHPGGHKRLSPARKDYLIELDRMQGVDHMPPPAELVSHLNQCSALYGSALNGIGVYMYFALDEDDLDHNEFADSSTLWTYAAFHRNDDWLHQFCHAILADCVTDPDQGGLLGITLGGAGGPFYVFVDTVANIASLRGVPFGQHFRSTFCHEATHSVLDTDRANGFDGWEHVEDPDSDGNYWEWDFEAEEWIVHGVVPDPQDVPVLMLNRWTVEQHTNPYFCNKTRSQIDLKGFQWR
jgi:hypothetical protein